MPRETHGCGWRIPVIVCALVCLVAVPSQADVSLSPLFSSDMMLQRGQPVRVWGRAAPGEKVRVSITGGATSSNATTADEQGDWLVELAPIDVGENLVLRVEGNNAIVLENVIMGDVWLCSGQSNMAWPLHACAAKADIAGADFPRIRRIKIKNVASTEPVPDAATDTPWQVCSPQTAAAFTGVGFYFAREVLAQTNVPIGLLDDAWHGGDDRHHDAEGGAGQPSFVEQA